MDDCKTTRLLSIAPRLRAFGLPAWLPLLAFLSTAAAGSATARDFTIASVGDSISSGEGCPDQSATAHQRAVWTDAPRHFSQKCGPSLFAQALSRSSMDNVAFLSEASSGARTTDLPSQLSRIAERAKGKRIDVLLISVGANDTDFEMLCRRLIHHGNPMSQLHCSTIENDFLKVGPSAGLALEKFPAAFQSLKSTINAMRLDGKLNVDDSAIYLMAYPDFTSGDTADASAVDILDDFVDPARQAVNGSINHGDLLWARDHLLRALNRQLLDCAKANRWNFVGNTEWVFLRHGYGARPEARWINTAADSRQIQNDQRGTLHPNFRGAQAVAWCLLYAIAPKLHLGTVISHPSFTELLDVNQQTIDPLYPDIWQKVLGPPPAAIPITQNGSSVGSHDGGREFRLFLEPGQRISRIDVFGHSGKYHVVSAISMFGQDAEGREFPLGTAGKIGGGADAVPQTVGFDKDEFLVGIDCQKGRWIDCIRFITNKHASAWLGGTYYSDQAHGPTSGHWELRTSPNEKMVGFMIYSTDLDFNSIQPLLSTR